jgi:hypothetical protein
MAAFFQPSVGKSASLQLLKQSRSFKVCRQTLLFFISGAIVTPPPWVCHALAATNFKTQAWRFERTSK